MSVLLVRLTVSVNMVIICVQLIRCSDNKNSRSTVLMCRAVVNNDTHQIENRCYRCSQCSSGEYMVQACSASKDTVCKECPNGKYSDGDNSSRCHVFRSQECSTYEKIIRRLGEDVRLNFSLSGIRDKYNTLYNGIAETDVETLNNDLEIIFSNVTSNVTSEFILYEEGSQTSLSNRYKISSGNDTIMVKINHLEIQHAGLYWADFRSYRYENKSLILARKPKIIPNDPPNPVLKPEDNFQTIIQLECQGQSTNVGLCQNNNSMFIIWYKNGVRMDTPTLNSTDSTRSNINVTVDLDGADYTCLVTSYPSCYQRLQTTTNYNNVLKIEVCEGVSGNWTFKIRPLFWSQECSTYEKIIRRLGEDVRLNFSLSGIRDKYNTLYNVIAETDVETLNDNLEIIFSNVTSNVTSGFILYYEGSQTSLSIKNGYEISSGNDTIMVKINRLEIQHAGLYWVDFRLLRYEKKSLILAQNDKNRELISEDKNHIIVAVTVVVVIVAVIVIVIVTIFVMYKKYRKERNDYKMIELKKSHNVVSRDQSHSEGEKRIFVTMDLYQGAPLTKNNYGFRIGC